MKWQVGVLGALACLATVGLYAYPASQPLVVLDDFQQLVRGWTWSSTCRSLWEPHNEHVVPLGRLWTWAVVHVVRRPTALPEAAVCHGVLALVAGMWLVYFFVSREVGQPLLGLVALILFGVSAVFQQAIYWFSASFSVLALDTTLLALLAAQRWRQTQRRPFLVACAIGAALAPGWFASGILAGPLCALYLLPWSRKQQPMPSAGFAARLTPFLPAAVPVLGTAVYLLLLLIVPGVTRHIMHLEHYGSQTAVQAFQPFVGLEYSGRSFVDNLLLGLFGVYGVHCPVVLVWFIVTGLAGVAGLWCWVSPQRRLMVLGLGFIVFGYVLVYSARATWTYDDNMNQPAWSRYHLGPQLGLALFVVGGLARWPQVFQPNPTGRLSRRQITFVTLAILLSFLVQFPRSIMGYWVNPFDEPVADRPKNNGPGEGTGKDVHAVGWLTKVRTIGQNETVTKQEQALRQIEEVDERCREHHIDAQTARAALGWLEIPLSFHCENGWSLLRGSPDPRPVSIDEARRLLKATPSG
jgi:hypothetical protein